MRGSIVVKPLCVIMLIFVFSIDVFANGRTGRSNKQNTVNTAEKVSAEEVHKLIEDNVQLREELAMLRAKSGVFLKKYNKNKENGTKPLPVDIMNLFDWVARYLEIRKILWQQVQAFSVYIKKKEQIWENKTLLQRKKILIAMTSALTLYDSYFLLVHLFEKNNKLRLLLNQGDGVVVGPGFVNKISKSARTEKYRRQLSRVVGAFDVFYSKKYQEEDEGEKLLIELVRFSPSIRIFRLDRIDRANFFAKFRIEGVSSRVGDAVAKVWRWVTNLLSGWFGNTIGSFERRKGKLYKDVQVVDELLDQIKPLDILLEKTPFRFTDKFIPGHWGHVAIWIGSVEQLRDAGLWDLIRKTKSWNEINFASDLDKRRETLATLKFGLSSKQDKIWFEVNKLNRKALTPKKNTRRGVDNFDSSIELFSKNGIVTERQMLARKRVVETLQLSHFVSNEAWAEVKQTKFWKNISNDKESLILEKLNSGKVILEALRPGVQLNSLEDFLNVDDLLLVRPTYLDNDLDKQAEFIADTLNHFGKDYDFNFDVTTPDKIVCSELAYWTFQDINWKTERLVGRESISPDNVISTILEDEYKFTPIELYHDGNKVEDCKGSDKPFAKELMSLKAFSHLDKFSRKIEDGEVLCN